MVHRDGGHRVALVSSGIRYCIWEFGLQCQGLGCFVRKNAT